MPSLIRDLRAILPWMALTCPSMGLAAPSTVSTNGHIVSGFSLQDFRGKNHDLDEFKRPIVVIAFLGTECPLAKLYAPRLATLCQQYRPLGVDFVAIDSNCQDSITEMAAYARLHNLNFPLLKDVGNRVADQLEAQRTPEVFVLDLDRRVRYRGRIDDQYGVGYVRQHATRNDLRVALDELLAGKQVSQPFCESVGCYIGRVPQPTADSSVTYANQISRILQRHCVECHRDGEIAPFTLGSYDEVSGWAETIAEVIQDRRMPPWHASPDYGKFANARRMTEDEKQLIYEWVENGAPEGDPKELPAPREFTEGWRLTREPDRVIAMTETPYPVPAEGTVEYQYFVVDPEFREDKWVSAAELVPGNRSVVHHAIVFIRPPGGERQKGIGWLAAYVPGQSTRVLPPGYARYVPAGSKLVFQMHYTPNGSPQQDITRVGILFADPATVTNEALTMVAVERDFEIPPNVEDYPVETWLGPFPAGSQLMAIAPHMHLRGKAFRFLLHRDREEEVLLDVPNYDFNWQNSYQFTEPKPLSDVRIQCLARFDNSEHNLVNPDPTQTVRWGDQTWEEMVVAYLEISVPRSSSERRGQTNNTSSDGVLGADAKQAAAAMFARFDRNGDGKIARDEVPEAFRVFAFSRQDSNGDTFISRDEAERAARQSLRRKRD